MDLEVEPTHDSHDGYEIEAEPNGNEMCDPEGVGRGTCREWQEGMDIDRKDEERRKGLLKTDHAQVKGWDILEHCLTSQKQKRRRRKRGEMEASSSNSIILELIKCESLSSWFTDVRKG